MEYRKEYGSFSDMPEEGMLSRALSDMGSCPCSQNGRSGQGSSTSNTCSCSRASRQENGNSTDRPGCVAGSGVDPLSGFPLAMAYVPNQPWEGIQEPEDALASGTLFTGLLFPWHPSRCGEAKGCGCGRN